MSNYSDLLRDPRWQKKRLKVLDRDNFTCRHCGAEDKTLHVHHNYYDQGKKPWEYEDGALITLCEDCHKNKHAVLAFDEEIRNDVIDTLENWHTEHKITWNHIDGMIRGIHGISIVFEISMEESINLEKWWMNKITPQDFEEYKKVPKWERKQYELYKNKKLGKIPTLQKP